MGTNTVGYTESESFRCLEDLEKAYVFGSGSPLRLCYCGMEDCEPCWCFGPYVRENYVIHVVTGGKGTFVADGKKHELSGGNVFAIYPGEETVYSADDNDPWSYMWVGFNGREAENVIRKIGFLRERPVIKIERTDGMTAALERILEAKQLTVAAAMKRTAAFYDFLAILMEQSRKEGTFMDDTEDRYVSRAVEIIATSYMDRVRISEVADVLGINRSYLSSIFKRKMHMSPQEFLINMRLEKAAQLLRDTQDQIGSVAAAVGYTDALAFSKAFKQKYNETPSDFRHSAPELASGSRKGGYTGNLGL